MIVAIELVKRKDTRQAYPWQERRGLLIYQHGLQNGVLLRPLNNVIYFMPPYVITPEEIQLMTDVAWQGIQMATTD
jgi:adenosylmethionine---8-amino-7-oxononanoate aminotransferase